MKTTLLVTMGAFMFQLTFGQSTAFAKVEEKTVLKQNDTDSYDKKELFRTHKGSKERLDSLINASLDSINMTFDLGDKHEFIYNTKEELVLEDIYYWNSYNNNWMKNYRHEYTYDINGNIVKSTTYNWKNSKWNLWAKQTRTYNINGYIEVDSSFSWNGNSWGCLGYEKYTYDINGNKTSYISYYLPWWLPSWTPLDKTEWSYNTNGNVTIELGYMWDDVNSIWDSIRKVENTYDINNLLIEEIVYNHDNNTWNKILKDEHVYDVNTNEIELTSYLWDNNTWTDLKKVGTSFDINGNRLSKIISYWNKTGGIWDDDFKYDYVYDNSFSLNANNLIIPYTLYDLSSKGELLSVTTFRWKTPTNFWNKEAETNYYYSGITTNIIEPTDENSIFIYPNPSNGIVNLEVTGRENITVDIINISGQQIYSKQVNKNTTKQIDLSKQSKGMYFIKAYVGEKMFVKKIMIN